MQCYTKKKKIWEMARMRSKIEYHCSLLKKLFRRLISPEHHWIAKATPIWDVSECTRQNYLIRFQRLLLNYHAMSSAFVVWCLHVAHSTCVIVYLFNCTVNESNSTYSRIQNGKFWAYQVKIQRYMRLICGILREIVLKINHLKSKKKNTVFA